MLATKTLFTALLGLLTPLATASDSRQSSSVNDIPPFGLGTWLSDRGKVEHAVEYAIKIGYRHIDAALVYGNEKEVGRGIAASGIDRSQLWVTSKLWNVDHRPEAARKAIETTIADLGVDYLDLYLVHWPVAFKPGGKQKLDHETSILDTWRALEGLVRDNKTRHIGISNFAPADVNVILSAADIRPYAHEFETHPYLQQQSWVDWHLERDIKVIAYSPLANTNPTYHKGAPPILKDPFWLDLAERKNATVAQVILAWGMQRGTVVIPKSVHEEYIEQNRGALDKDIKFTEAELREVASYDRKVRMNDPGRKWGVDLFKGLDDPTNLRKDDEGLEL